ncbi:Ca(2+)-dependent cysteine protease [Microbotryomycetes sp. JL201]|nr:Ca(2+)-dependent cysteine protease [Microbotryomycetes sp. JL201]
MSYPGAGRPQHGHHQTVAGYGQGNYGPPPPQQQWGGPPGGYNPGYAMPDPNAQYQSYPGGGPGGYGGYNSGPPPPQQQAQMPAPMHYAAPSQAPPSGQGFGPAQYQSAEFQPHFQPPPNQQHLYSDCSGRRKALLIGINYTGTSAALRGWHVIAVCYRLYQTDSLSGQPKRQRYQYKREDMVMLLDLPNLGPMEQPTRANITRAMQWLVSDARPSDSLFFHYSGHGGQAKDVDGDEEDGYDETILPVDYKTAGQMVDDEIHHYLVRPLPQGVRLTAIFDSCHSGSALDLPYIYSTKGVIKTPNKAADLGQGALGAFTSYARGDMGGLFKAVTGAGKKLMSGDKAYEKTKREKSSLADVISFSGSKDSQTSADAQIGGQATGAMSHAFVASLTKYPQQSYLQLLNTIRDEISQYSQKPQLSSSHEMDLNLLFVM